MLRNVYLYGALGRRFGYRHRFDVENVAEAVWALSANHKGFREYFFRGPAYSFVKGATCRSGSDLDLLELPMSLGKHDLHIIPAAYGRGGGGSGKSIGKIILGVVMIAGAFLTAGASLGVGAAASASSLGGAAAAAAAGGAAGAMSATAIALPLGLGAITYSNIAAAGAMMLLSGVAQLVSPTPQASQAAYTNFERPEARASFIYSGATNTSEQGGPIPILYGRMRIGSTLISASVSSDQVESTVTSGEPGTTARQEFSGGEL